MAEDEAAKTDEPAAESPPEAPQDEATYLELRDHVPPEIRNASFPAAMRGYDRRAVDAYVKRVNRVIAELEVSRSPQAAVRHALDRVGEQTIAILREARESAEKMAAAAREDADQTMADAKAQAADLVVNASADAERERAGAAQAVAEARAQAEAIVSEARAEAERIVGDARAQAAQDLQRSQEELAALQRDAEARMHDLESDTDTVWTERDALLDDLRSMGTRLHDLAGAAASRRAREKAGSATAPRTEPEPDEEPVASAEPDEEPAASAETVEEPAEAVDPAVREA
jgi:DivIVA domain-containing protein